MNKLASAPAADSPHCTRHSTSKLPANATWTSSRRGDASVGIAWSAARERSEERGGEARRELVLEDGGADGDAPDLREGAQEDVERGRGRVLFHGERREEGEVCRAVDGADADAG